MKTCPIKKEKRECSVCPYGKPIVTMDTSTGDISMGRKLCDFPYIGSKEAYPDGIGG